MYYLWLVLCEVNGHSNNGKLTCNSASAVDWSTLVSILVFGPLERSATALLSLDKAFVRSGQGGTESTCMMPSPSSCGALAPMLSVLAFADILQALQVQGRSNTPSTSSYWGPKSHVNVTKHCAWVSAPRSSAPVCRSDLMVSTL